MTDNPHQQIDRPLTFALVNDAEFPSQQIQLPMIVSGGQTGVDRAALDVARELGLRHGGWCPAGRKAEDGVIPECYELKETPSGEYRERTRRNVMDSNATLILCAGPLTGGTELTLREAKRLRKPHLVVNLLHATEEFDRTLRWLKRQNAWVLNVAGPRASQHPGIACSAKDFLRRVFADLKSV